MNINILVINPGSTSTKIAYFVNKKEIWMENIHHSNKELENCKTFDSRLEFTSNKILEVLKKHKILLKDITAFAPRGGISLTLPSGTFKVNQKLCDFLKNSKIQHPSNFASPIAFNLSKEFKQPCYFTDSPATSEIFEEAKYSGLKEIDRVCRFHALNQKAAAKKYCLENNLDYYKSNFIVIHMGGGISVGAHKDGRVIDVNDCLEEGPYSPERTGQLPIRQLMEMCFSGKYTLNDMLLKIRGQGGLVSYLDTNDGFIILDEIEKGNQKYINVLNAMFYQIACEAAKRLIPLNGKYDALIITGGFSNCEEFVNNLKKYLTIFNNIVTYPGELEMEALAINADDAFNKKIQLKKIKY